MTLSAHEIADQNRILLTTVGSGVHGLALLGQDDHDEMAVCCEPPGYALGIEQVWDWKTKGWKRFEQDWWRTAEERALSEGKALDQGWTPQSQPGDTDRITYSLTKFARLAAAGNPTVLILLYADPTEASPLGDRLQQNWQLFASKEAGERFLGYLQEQRRKMIGEKSPRIQRPHLVAAHGFDVKFACHAVRLGFQGIEFLATSRLVLPMPEPARQTCLQIRRGEWRQEEVLDLILRLEGRVRQATAESSLPDHPDRRGISELVAGIYREWWGW